MPDHSGSQSNKNIEGSEGWASSNSLIAASITSYRNYWPDLWQCSLFDSSVDPNFSDSYGAVRIRP